jgi:hypothetical protein
LNPPLRGGGYVKERRKLAPSLYDYNFNFKELRSFCLVAQAMSMLFFKKIKKIFLFYK